MEFVSINKVIQSRFIARYDVRYKTCTGADKVYEMVSRDKGLTTQTQLLGRETDAVIMFLTDAAGQRLLLLREFRMATGQAIFNMPAGLMDPGESLLDAARRELREETGLELVEIHTILPAAYSAIGFSNEKNTLILGTAQGEIQPSDSPEEEIEAAWYTREQVRELIQACPFESRTQLFCHMWAGGAI